MKKIIGVLLILTLHLTSCSLNNMFVKPMNYELLERTISAVEKLIRENHVTKVALCNFVNEKGKQDAYSEQFYDALYDQFVRRYSNQYQIISRQELRQILQTKQIKNEGSLTAFEITSLFDEIQNLNGICTGFIGGNSYYLTLFTPKDMYDNDSKGSKISDVDWQVEISNLLNKMIAKIKNATVQPICISTFDNFSDYTSNTLGKFLSYKIYTELHNTHQLNIIHRDDLPKILKEYELGQAGFIKPDNALKFGELVGAKTILIGKTSGDVNKSWYLNLSLIDLLTGQTLWTDDYVKIGSDFFDTFAIQGIDNIDFSNMSKFNKKVLLELINSADEKSSIVALKQSMIYLIMENAVSQEKSLTFTKGVIDSLLYHQRYRHFEIDSIYINELKKAKKLQQR